MLTWPAFYGVQTRALNQAVKRNQERFPADFMFELTREEILGISQTVTSLRKLRFSKQVRAFTEHGALMAASILNSPRAVTMSLYVIRAFITMREELGTNARQSHPSRKCDRFRWELGFGAPLLPCSLIHSGAETLRFHRQHPNRSVPPLRQDWVLGFPARSTRKEKPRPFSYGSTRASTSSTG